MGIGLGEAAYGRIIVAGAEVIASGFSVQVFAAAAEGVGIQGVRVLFVAKSKELFERYILLIFCVRNIRINPKICMDACEKSDGFAIQI